MKKFLKVVKVEKPMAKSQEAMYGEGLLADEDILLSLNSVHEEGGEYISSSGIFSLFYKATSPTPMIIH